jgi:20S proteasome subunit beta 7
MTSVVSATPKKHTTRPIVTGTSVLGIVYNGGVLLASDTLLSYGGMAKHQGISRIHHISNTKTIIAASGEYSDFQMIVRTLEEKSLQETQTSSVLMASLYDNEDDTENVNNGMCAAAVWNYLRYLLYAKRNKFNPYWNDILVAGTDTEGKPFLGSVDKIGTTITDNVLATGFGSYLAIPLLREQWRPDLTEGEARAMLEDCLRVLFYHAPISPLISDPYPLEHTSWNDPAFVQAAPAQLDGDGGW